MKISLRQYWNLFVNYLKPQWPRVLALTGLLFANIGLLLAMPQLVRLFLDTAEAGGAVELLRRIAIIFIVVAVVQQIVNVLATYVSENVGWTTTNALREDLAKHCLYLDLSFHNSRTPGEMIERIDGDVLGLANFFSQFVIQVLGNIALLVGILFLLFRENIWVGVVLTAFAMLAFIILMRFRNIAVPHWASERQASAELFGYLEERLSGTEDIRSNRAQEYVLHHFYRLMRALMKYSMKAAMMVNVLFNSMLMLFALGIAIAFAVGGYLFLAGVITIGTVYLIFHYATMLERPITNITRQLEDLQRAGAGVGRIQELLNVKNNLKAEGIATDRIPNGTLSQGSALGILFDRVTFGYHDAVVDEPVQHMSGDDGKATPEADADDLIAAEKNRVVEDLSFNLEAGEVLGLLGRTGSGKTTLIRLLFRFYDPDSGAVYITVPEKKSDGNESAEVSDILIDLRAMPLRDLRQQIGIATQNIQLFHASVRDNLTFFDKSIPDDEIIKVINELGMSQWYQALPQGLETELESGGGGLSAGEAQLLAFARVFLKDPGLVILDEASSRLDPSTEGMIEQAVDRLVQDRTVIIIAHRLGTVQKADKIMILDNGMIQEFGDRIRLANDTESKFNQLLRTGLEEVLT